MLFSIFLAMLFEEGPNPLKSLLLLLLLFFFFRVKFRRCAEGAKKLRCYSNTTKLTGHFISPSIFSLINYNFLKMPRKEPSQNLSGHAAG